MTRSSRLQKKLHKYWLENAIVDLSQSAKWRERLFASRDNVLVSINADNSEGLPQVAKNAIEKYDLEYTACKVPKDQALEPWLAEDGLVLFEFKAKDYPSVIMQTGNNPDVI